MGYQYTYLLMSILFLVVWLGLFLWRIDTRKEMLAISVICSFAGPATDILYTQDWWKPLTLTRTTIGLESVLVAFLIGGIASVIYEVLFRKKIRRHKSSKTVTVQRYKQLLITIFALSILFFGSFYLLKLSSFYSTIIALLIPIYFIWTKRSDLIKNSLLSGILLVVTASIIYSILEAITPGWIDAFWVFKNVPPIVIFNLPLDDIIWYFLAGLFIGPFYEYWQEVKLTNA